MDFSKDKKNGFSLVEAAIILAVLSIFSAVAIPAFNCVRRRAISTTAQETIRRIKEECETNYIYGIDKFTASNPDKYQISASGSNSCSGGTVTLTPEDINLYPTYFYKFADSELSYNFKGQTGTSFVACNKLICGDGEPKKKINLDYDFVVENTYIEKGCSAYVFVEGPSWEEAEENAKKLGGHLASINDQEESDWIEKEFSKVEKYAYPGDTNPGDPENWISLWIGGQYVNGGWEWTSNEEWVDGGTGDDYSSAWGFGKPDNYGSNKEIYSKTMAHFNHWKNENQYTVHGEGEGTWYWSQTKGVSNNTRGIAEIPICN